MNFFARKYKSEFQTSKTLNQISTELWRIADFSYHTYSSSQHISKSYIGDVIKPGFFKLRRRPLTSGPFDMKITGATPGPGTPQISISVKFDTVNIELNDKSQIFTLIISFFLLVWGLAIANAYPDMELYIKVIITAITIIICFLVNAYSHIRYKSMIKFIEKKLIRRLK